MYLILQNVPGFQTAYAWCALIKDLLWKATIKFSPSSTNTVGDKITSEITSEDKIPDKKCLKFFILRLKIHPMWGKELSTNLSIYPHKPLSVLQMINCYCSHFFLTSLSIILSLYLHIKHCTQSIIFSLCKAELCTEHLIL